MMRLLFWGLTVVVAIATGLYFDIPFLRFLIPGKDIALVQIHPSGEADILARSAETLWYHWQSWLFIGLFCVVIAFLCAIAIGIVNGYADERIIEKKQILDNKILELERSKETFERKTRKELEDALQEEDLRLSQVAKNIENDRQKANRLRFDAVQLNQKTNIANQQQNRENRSKLAQRDRLSEQKKLLSEYLKQSGWKFTDGEPITYSSLLKLAKQSKN
ncbi:hypothetical protein ACPF37_003518 [Vibrio cholerae]